MQGTAGGYKETAKIGVVDRRAPLTYFVDLSTAKNQVVLYPKWSGMEILVGARGCCNLVREWLAEKHTY